MGRAVCTSGEGAVNGRQVNVGRKVQTMVYTEVRSLVRAVKLEEKRNTGHILYRPTHSHHEQYCTGVSLVSPERASLSSSLRYRDKHQLTSRELHTDISSGEAAIAHMILQCNRWPVLPELQGAAVHFIA